MNFVDQFWDLPSFFGAGFKEAIKFKFFNWIYRIAVNESLNYIKQQSRTEDLDTDLISPENTPEESFSETELASTIQDSLMELEPDYRILIVLKHFQSFSYNEIACILDMQEKTVKSRLFTARQLLREVLIRKGVLAHD